MIAAKGRGVRWVLALAVTLILRLGGCGRGLGRTGGPYCRRAERVKGNRTDASGRGQRVPDSCRVLARTALTCQVRGRCQLYQLVRNRSPHPPPRHGRVPDDGGWL